MPYPPPASRQSVDDTLLPLPTRNSRGRVTWFRTMKRRLLVVLLHVAVASHTFAEDTNAWLRCLATMPLPEGTRVLERTNCIPVMLDALRSNSVVRGIVFLPGATDEFYHFRRARAVLTNSHPTLADAVTALSEQTLLLATYRPPLLLLHTWEDPTTPEIHVEHEATAEKLRRVRFVEQGVFNDKSWNVLQPLLQQRLNVFVRPNQGTTESWHFYRHSLAGWNLSGWESLEAISLAGMTAVTVKRRQVVFTGDTRPRWNRELKTPAPTGSP